MSIVEGIYIDGQNVPKPEIRAYLSNREILCPEDYNAVGDGAADDTEPLQDAIDAVPDGGALFLQRTYRTTAQLLCENKAIHIIGHGTPYDARAPRIVYDGAANSAIAVLKIYANATSIIKPIVQNVTLDANSKAGSCLWLAGNTGAMKIGAWRDLSLLHFTASGLRLSGGGSAELSEQYYYRLFIYSAATSEAGYGIHADAGGNLSLHRFYDCKIEGGASAGEQLKNCVYMQTGSGFSFIDPTFAQTIAQSGTDGYAVYSVGGLVSFTRGWNEANGWLYQGDTGAYSGTTQFTDTFLDNSPPLSVFFNHPSINLSIKGAHFTGDVSIGANVTPARVSIEATFAAGRGVKDNMGASEVLVTGWAKGGVPNQTITASGAGTLVLSGLARQFRITLTGNCTIGPPTSGVQPFDMYLLQDATGTRVPTWDAAYRSPPTLTTTANKMDHVAWSGDIAGVLYKRGQNLNQ